MHRYTDSYWKRVHLSLESSRYRIWKQAALALSKKRRERESQTLFCHDSPLSFNSTTKDSISSHGIQPYFTDTSAATTKPSGITSQDALSTRTLLDSHQSAGLSSLLLDSGGGGGSVFNHEKDYLSSLQTTNLKEYRDRNCNLTSVRIGSPTNGACDGALPVERRMNTNGRGAMTRSSTPTTSADSRPVGWGPPPPHTPPRPSLYSSSRPTAQDRPAGVDTGHTYSVTPEQSPRLYPGEPYPPTLTTSAPVFPLAVYPYPYPSQLYQTSLIRRVQEQQQQHQQQPLPHARQAYPFPIPQRNLSPPPPVNPGLPSAAHYNLPSQHQIRGRPFEPHPRGTSPPPPPPPREDRYLSPGASGHSSTHFKLDPSRSVDPYKRGPSFERPSPVGPAGSLVRQGPSSNTSSSIDDYLKHTVKAETQVPKIRHTELGPLPGSASSSSSAAASRHHHYQHHQHHQQHSQQHHHHHRPHHPHHHTQPQSYPTSSTVSTSSISSAQQQQHHQQQQQASSLYPSYHQRLPSQQHHFSSVVSSHQVRSSQASPLTSSHTSPSDQQGRGAAAASSSSLPAGTSTTTTQPHYPPHFMKGSVIQLANGDLKRVEDLRTEDFVHSADISTDLKIDSSQVVHIEEMPDRGTAILGFSVGPQKIRVTVEATLEHPFFVFGQGWSSCSPDKTRQHYDLHCHKLVVGDICISLTQRQTLSSSSTSLATSTTTIITTATITTNGQILSSSSRIRSPPQSPQEIVEVESPVNTEADATGYRATHVAEAGSISGNHGNSSGSNASQALSSGQPEKQGSAEGDSAELRRSREYLPPLTDDEGEGSTETGTRPRKRRRSAQDTLSGTDEGPIDVTDSSGSSTNARTPELPSGVPSTGDHYSTGIL